jgi:energy-coupling factor transporter ATP-binding protein EcfA2
MQILYFADFKEENNFFKGCDFNFTNKYCFESKSKFHSETKIEIELLCQRQEDSPNFSFVNGINDVKVLIGSNGIGKTTLFNKIFYTLSNSNNHITFSDLLITDKFCFIGGALELSENSFKIFYDLFGSNYKFYVHNEFYLKSKYYLEQSFIKMAYSGSSIADKISNYVLIYHNNAYEVLRTTTSLGDIISTQDIVENASTLIDISLVNTMASSNSKYLFHSELRNFNILPELITFKFRDSLNIFGFYKQCPDLFDNIFEKNIKERIGFGLRKNSIIDKIFDYIEGTVPASYFYENHKFYLLHHTGFKANNITHLYREFVLSVLIMSIDRYTDKDLIETIIKLLDSFEKLNPGFKAHETIDHEQYVIFVDNFIDSYPYADMVNAKEAYKIFTQIIELIMKSEHASKFVMNSSFDDYSSVKFRFNDEFLSKFVQLCQDLQNVENYNFPLFNIQVKDLSSGEYNLLTFISRLYFVFTNSIHDEENSKTKFTLILDEPELGFHPEWQRTYYFKFTSFINYIKTRYPSFEAQLILGIHSPLLLSDFKSCQILRLTKNKDGLVEIANSSTSPFGANIYSILKDDFFFQNGFIGEFASKILKDLLFYLNKELFGPCQFFWNQKNALETINEIGDELLRTRFQALYEEKFLKERKVILQERKKRIEEELKSIEDEENKS